MNVIDIIVLLLLACADTYAEADASISGSNGIVNYVIDDVEGDSNPSKRDDVSMVERREAESRTNRRESASFHQLHTKRGLIDEVPYHHPQSVFDQDHLKKSNNDISMTTG